MTYDGGKNGEGVYQAIINQMPPHRRYIEMFLGSGAIMRRKAPAKINVGIEIDADAFAAVKSILPASFTVYHGDGLEIVKGFFHREHNPAGKDDLIYADPPYLMETRSCKRDLYRHEFKTVEEQDPANERRTLV